MELPSHNNVIVALKRSRAISKRSASTGMSKTKRRICFYDWFRV